MKNENNISRPYQVPIWHKATLSMEEAMAYTGIGRDKLREMTNREDCPFILWNGSKRLIKRKEFERVPKQSVFNLGGVAMDNEILKYRQRLKERAAQKPIWEKACLTIEEAAEYTGIGRTKLRALVRQKKCPFSMPTGNQILIVREKFDDYIKGRKRI